MTPEQRKHFEWVRDNMHGEPQTRVADNVAWHLHQELKKAKQQRPTSRIDAKFNDWAKRNGVNLNELKVMQVKNK